VRKPAELAQQELALVPQKQELGLGLELEQGFEQQERAPPMPQLTISYISQEYYSSHFESSN